VTDRFVMFSDVFERSHDRSYATAASMGAAERLGHALGQLGAKVASRRSASLVPPHQSPGKRWETPNLVVVYSDARPARAKQSSVTVRSSWYEVGFRRPKPHKRAGEDKMTNFELLQVVELTNGFPSEGNARRTRGTIVEKFDTPSEAYDVEIVSDDGATEILLPSVRPSQIRVVRSLVV
jgi:hypothetical protein